MVKNLNLIGNSTSSPSLHPSIWCQNVLVQNRLGELTRLVRKRLGAETSGPNRLSAEMSVNHQNAAKLQISSVFAYLPNLISVNMQLT